MSSPELFLTNTFLFTAHQLCGEEILCNASDDILFRSYRARGQWPGQFLPSHFVPGLRLRPQCVKEPQTGLSHQTATNQPVAKVSNHALLVFSCHSRAPIVVYRIRINQLESLLLLSSLAFKLIKLPTKYSLNFKASCWALVRSSHERDTQSKRCDTED